MAHARRLIALLVLALVLCAALVPGGAGLLCAVLVPLLFVKAAPSLKWIRREDAGAGFQPSPFAPALAPRAPPAA